MNDDSAARCYAMIHEPNFNRGDGFSAPSQVPGPNGPRHPTAFYDACRDKIEDYGSLSNEEQRHILEGYFEWVCWLAGAWHQPRGKAFWILMAGENRAMGRRTERRRIAPKVRFTVLRRDNYTCQYCGAKAPNVQLTIDHALPVAKGGGNDISNLVTACSACNYGKGAEAAIHFEEEV